MDEADEALAMLQADLARVILVQGMRKLGVPVTRANYIRLNWATTPSPWQFQHEIDLPMELQDWAQYAHVERGRP